MKKFLKWLGIVVGSVVGLVVVVVAWIFIASSMKLGQKYAFKGLVPIKVPSDATEIAEGKRLARLTGCSHCHSEKLTGAVPIDIPNVVRFVAPNVTVTAPKYDDATLAALIREGIKSDGTGVYFMPSEMFRHLSDQDVARIIAWVRTVPEGQGVTGKTEVRPVGRMIIAKGDFKSGPEHVHALGSGDRAVDQSTPVGRGRYLVMNLCSECHGQDLNGRPEAHNAPALSVVKAYSVEQFGRLMHDGIALGDRQLELMSDTARARFSVLTADETAAMYEFLQSRG